MCCLFGILDYGSKLTRKEKTKILSVLSVACEERGTDATGIAYNSGDSLRIYKRSLPAHRLWFKIHEDTRAVMGHTRMTTQGSEKYLPNNHPFPGKTGASHSGIRRLEAGKMKHRRWAVRSHRRCTFLPGREHSSNPERLEGRITGNTV